MQLTLSSIVYASPVEASSALLSADLGQRQMIIARRKVGKPLTFSQFETHSNSKSDGPSGSGGGSDFMQSEILELRRTLILGFRSSKKLNLSQRLALEEVEKVNLNFSESQMNEQAVDAHLVPGFYSERQSGGRISIRLSEIQKSWNVFDRYRAVAGLIKAYSLNFVGISQGEEFEKIYWEAIKRRINIPKFLSLGRVDLILNSPEKEICTPTYQADFLPNSGHLLLSVFTDPGCLNSQSSLNLLNQNTVMNFRCEEVSNFVINCYRILQQPDSGSRCLLLSNQAPKDQLEIDLERGLISAEVFQCDIDSKGKFSIQKIEKVFKLGQ